MLRIAIAAGVGYFGGGKVMDLINKSKPGSLGDSDKLLVQAGTAGAAYLAMRLLKIP